MPSNVQKLIFVRMGYEAIPPNGGFEDGIEFLLDKNKIAAGYKKAKKFVMDSIELVKQCPDNPYKSDEEIATVILAEIERKKLAKSPR